MHRQADRFAVLHLLLALAATLLGCHNVKYGYYETEKEAVTRVTDGRPSLGVGNSERVLAELESSCMRLPKLTRIRSAIPSVSHALNSHKYYSITDVEAVDHSGTRDVGIVPDLDDWQGTEGSEYWENEPHATQTPSLVEQYRLGRSHWRDCIDNLDERYVGFLQEIEKLLQAEQYEPFDIFYDQDTGIEIVVYPSNEPRNSNRFPYSLELVDGGVTAISRPKDSLRLAGLEQRRQYWRSLLDNEGVIPWTLLFSYGLREAYYHPMAALVGSKNEEELINLIWSRLMSDEGMSELRRTLKIRYGRLSTSASSAFNQGIAIAAFDNIKSEVVVEPVLVKFAYLFLCSRTMDAARQGRAIELAELQKTPPLYSTEGLDFWGRTPEQRVKAKYREEVFDPTLRLFTIEIATIIAHEIGHAYLRNSKYDSQKEREKAADHFALQLMQRVFGDGSLAFRNSLFRMAIEGNAHQLLAYADLERLLRFTEAEP